MKNRVYFLSTTILFLILFTGQTFSQCKYCSQPAVFGGFKCANVDQNHRTGGCDCSASGDSCTLSNPCTTTFGCLGEKTSPKQTLVLFDEKTINEISVKFPRLAVALIVINNKGGFKKDISVFTPSGEIYNYEVSNWVIAPGEMSDSKKTFFDEFRKRVESDKEPPSITFSIQKAKGSNFILKAVVTQDFSNDPKYTGAIFKINKNKVAGWELTDPNE